MDAMDTEPEGLAGSKRNAASPSNDDDIIPSSRDVKRARKSPETPSAEPQTKPTKLSTVKKAPVSVTPDPEEESDNGDGTVITFPPKAKPLGQPKQPPTAAAQNAGQPTNDNNPQENRVLNQSATIPTSSPRNNLQRSHNLLFSIMLMIVCLCCAAAFFERIPSTRTFQHVIPPKHALKKAMSSRTHGVTTNDELHRNLELHLSNLTLREFLMDPKGFHLGMAPSFFGFYGYFGSLAAWDEGLSRKHDDNNNNNNQTSFLDTGKIKSLAGASAGAIAAMLLALGIPPRKAADFGATIKLTTFADPPGIAAFFKGDKFKQLMFDFVKSQVPNHSMLMQDSKIPVAVTGFDLQTLSTLVMTKGCVARSAGASATFPFLFQPVHWFDDAGKEYVLIDGGIEDSFGLEGLSMMYPDQPNKRVVNMVVGNFGGVGNGAPPGLSDMPPGLSTSELLSISIRHLPQCGPWAMQNGPLAVEAAHRAMTASLDLPLYRGKEDGHYELHIDASSFIPAP